MKIEVFKTNVLHADEAKMLVDQIHTSFTNYKANFDLEDCDHILRVACPANIHIPDLIRFLNDRGYNAEVLTDDIPEVLEF